MTSLVLCLFFISALPVLALFLGPTSVHGGPRNSRPTGYQLLVQEEKESFSFLIASEKAPGLQLTGSLSQAESIWAIYLPQKLGGLGES